MITVANRVKRVLRYWIDSMIISILVLLFQRSGGVTIETRSKAYLSNLVRHG